MANQQSDIVVTRIATVLNTDCEPIDQPKGTHRYALNAINEHSEGGQSRLSNELSNQAIESLTTGFLPVGHRYMNNDTTAVISTNPSTGVTEIGIINRSDEYEVIVNTLALGITINKQCDVRFRVRRGNERVIYWVDGLHRPRTFNLDRPQNFWNNTYSNYIKGGGNPDTFVGEKWDESSFNLQKTYSKIPTFSNVSIIETGSILPGSYNFAVQYIDEDLNPTEWITVSNIVRIYNDTITNPFERIRGSKNIDTLAQKFDRASKSIKLTITNLDLEFPYYRVAIIRAAGLNGDPEKVLASDLYSTSDNNFVYTGNDSQLTEVAITDILIGSDIIYAPQHIEQDENRLILANGKGKGINWCDFQTYASRISSDLATKSVVLNNVHSEPNIKNAKSTFFYRGYMPGEVYSFGIAYLFNDGYVSPVFHIPGKGPANTTSLMKVYEGNTKYLDIHNCATDNYWDRDSDDNPLIAENIRHHRFPFRKEVNKPLFTRVNTPTTLTKYRLKLSIGLAVGKDYPVDGDDPIPIEYQINYQINGAISTTQFNDILTESQLDEEVIIYDDSIALDDIVGLEKGELDAGCQMALEYMDVGDETFVLTFTYESYVASTSFDSDTSEIFGIDFSNIEKPHPDVVGFYIVRNERTDDDKIIVDNAIFGNMTTFQQYKSFGLLTPKQYYTASNCGRTGNSGKTLSYYDKGVWFFNPEFQFFNKKQDFTSIEVEGVYAQDTVSMPTISNVEGSECNGGEGTTDGGGSKGVYIEDVQAGTSYNPDVNKAKDKDDDGFDLIVGYRNTSFSYEINDTLVFPTKRLVLYLNAASYQNDGEDTFYNVSVDNKIGQYLTDEELDSTILDTLHDSGDNTNGLIYGSLVKDNTTAYSNFLTKPYYKEHNNPYYFGDNTVVNGIKVYNGDAEISALNMVSSVFYDIVVADRTKKSKVWKIIVGALLVVASVAAIVVTAGAALPLASLGISYGISLASSGIKFEQMKSMIDEDYEKGLRDTVTDGGVFETIRDTVGKDDDTIRWFADRISNIYIESSVPFGLRSGITSGVSDFMDAPSTYNEEIFRTYLTEKFTVLDREQGSGRLYKGYAGAEFYDMNKDYLRFNKQKIFVHLPVEYDCCSDENELFPLRHWYSEQSFQEEKVDNYRIFLPNNYKDIEGEHGEVTNLYRLGNSLFTECKEVLWQLPQNNQERVTGEVVSFIGTGSFFSIPPRKVLDDQLGSGGTQHKWATIKTQYGVLSVNETKHSMYFNAGTLKEITKGNRNWFNKHLRSFLKKQLFDNFDVEFMHDNNPANPYGIGYHSTYDTRHERILITKIDYLILQQKLGLLQIVDEIPTEGIAFAYCTLDGCFYDGANKLLLTNPNFFENKSWTMSYSVQQGGFIGWHSYLPRYYINTQNNLYSFVGSNILKHHREGHVQTFNNIYYPHIIEYVSVNNPLTDKALEDITFHTRARRWNAATGEYIEMNNITYNKILCYNGKQSTGEQIMEVKTTRPDPAKWLFQQTVNNSGRITLERDGRNWNVNRFRDYVVDYDKPLFNKDWSVIRSEYPIDKVVNTATMDFSKNWQELQVLRDKYVIIRLKFDNFNDVNLLFSYSLETEPVRQ